MIQIKDITLSNAKDFIEGNTKEVLEKVGLHQQHELEQKIWRAWQCIDCTKLGYCKICKCSTPVLFYASSRVDKLEKWTAFKSKAEWETFKKSDHWKRFIKILENLNLDISTDTIRKLSDYSYDELSIGQPEAKSRLLLSENEIATLRAGQQESET